MRFVVFYILIAAALIRFIALDQSLWLDEAIGAQVVKNLSFEQILTQFSPTDFHPPLYYLILKGWTAIFGYSEIALRTPSIIFSLLAGYLIYRMVRHTQSKRVALAAMAFFLFNPLMLYYSQEARMYSLVTLGITMVLYGLEQRLRGSKIWYGVILNAGIVLSMLSFYGSFLMLVGIVVVLILKRQWKLIALLAPGTILGVLLITPLLIQQLSHAGIALAAVPNWSMVLGTVTIKNIFLIPVKLVIGRISFDPTWLYYLCAATVTAITWYWVYRGSRLYRQMALYVVVPVLLGLIISFWFPMLQYFRFLYLLVPISVLLAVGTAKHLFWRDLIMGIFVICSTMYLLVPGFHREDWKHVLISVTQNQPVYIIPEVSDPLTYYYPDHPQRSLRKFVDLPPPGERTEETLPSSESLIAQMQDQTLVVIPYAAPIFGIDYQSALTELNYRLDEQIDYNGVVLEYWIR
ncbi:MAG: glycosyltransferase family 39 protein [Patescibacteria group bacterium]